MISSRDTVSDREDTCIAGLPGCFFSTRRSPSSCSWLTSLSCASSPLFLNFCVKTETEECRRHDNVSSIQIRFSPQLSHYCEPYWLHQLGFEACPERIVLEGKLTNKIRCSSFPQLLSLIATLKISEEACLLPTSPPGHVQWQSPHLILHLDAFGVSHAVAPVSVEDPLLLAWQVDQLLVAALHVLVQRGQVVASLLGALLQNTQHACQMSTLHK